MRKTEFLGDIFETYSTLRRSPFPPPTPSIQARRENTKSIGVLVAKRKPIITYLVSDIVKRVFAVNIGLVALAITTVWFDSQLVSFAALALGSLAVGQLLVTFARGRSQEIA